MAGRGGRRPNTGGKRPGAGRKLAPAVLAWRDHWRSHFNNPTVRDYLWKQAKRLLEKENDASLINKLIDKTEPTPTEVDVNINRIPPDFVFDVQLVTRGESPSPGSMAVPAFGGGGSHD